LLSAPAIATTPTGNLISIMRISWSTPSTSATIDQKKALKNASVIESSFRLPKTSVRSLWPAGHTGMGFLENW
jgi:hypothetical protein